MSEYFPKLRPLEGSITAELDLSKFATKFDFKNVTIADTSEFAKNTDLANLKSDVDKLDIDKLKNAPSGLRSLESKVYKLDIDNWKLLQLI